MILPFVRSLQLYLFIFVIANFLKFILLNQNLFI